MGKGELTNGIIGICSPTGFESEFTEEKGSLLQRFFDEFGFERGKLFGLRRRHCCWGREG